MTPDLDRRMVLYDAAAEVAELIFRGLKEHQDGDQTTLEGWLAVRRQNDHGNAKAAEDLNKHLDRILPLADSDPAVFKTLRREAALRLRNRLPLSWEFAVWAADVLEGNLAPPSSPKKGPTDPAFTAAICTVLGHLRSILTPEGRKQPVLPFWKNNSAEHTLTICDAVAEGGRRAGLERITTAEAIRSIWVNHRDSRPPEPISSEWRPVLATTSVDLRQPPHCDCLHKEERPAPFEWDFAVQYGRKLEAAMNRLRELARESL